MRMAFALFAGIVAAQAQVTFEAASIKPSTAQGEGTSFDRTAGMLRVRNGSLQQFARLHPGSIRCWRCPDPGSNLAQAGPLRYRCENAPGSPAKSAARDAAGAPGGTLQAGSAS
ncbi:exported hypothetical protein [Candidatus Sulfopaludibacter sp. SbA3]|nr:exported hypothetical protein [Candidatus Sulfopaludibacter sp. SbA3]